MGTTYACLQGSEPGEDEGVQEEWEVEVSDTQASWSQESCEERNVAIRVAEKDRCEEHQRKSLPGNKKDDFYRQTRCTCRGQEESSVMPRES